MVSAMCFLDDCGGRCRRLLYGENEDGQLEALHYKVGRCSYWAVGKVGALQFWTRRLTVILDSVFNQVQAIG